MRRLIPFLVLGAAGLLFVDPCRAEVVAPSPVQAYVWLAALLILFALYLAIPFLVFAAVKTLLLVGTTRGTRLLPFVFKLIQANIMGSIAFALFRWSYLLWLPSAGLLFYSCSTGLAVYFTYRIEMWLLAKHELLTDESTAAYVKWMNLLGGLLLVLWQFRDLPRNYKNWLTLTGG